TAGPAGAELRRDRRGALGAGRHRHVADPPRTRAAARGARREDELSCDPERVPGFVDGELDAQARAAVAAHLETCPACRAQAEAERALRARLRSLPGPELPAGLGVRVLEAKRLRPSGFPAAARWALPLAAVLLLGVWLRGYAPFVAWDLARDHDKCFSRRPLPAKLWSGE